MGEPQTLRRSSRRRKPATVQNNPVQTVDKINKPKNAHPNDVGIFQDITAIESSSSEGESEGESAGDKRSSTVEVSVNESTTPELSVLDDDSKLYFTDPIYDENWTEAEKARSVKINDFFVERLGCRPRIIGLNRQLIEKIKIIRREGTSKRVTDKICAMIDSSSMEPIGGIPFTEILKRKMLFLICKNLFANIHVRFLVHFTSVTLVVVT